MKKRSRFVYAGLVALSLLTGCAGQDSAAQHQSHQLPNGDLQEVTASITTLPTFLDKVEPQIKDIYQIAAGVQDVLKSIPCYCGCGESAGHLHNGNCFIKEVKQDGSVVWDDHGTRCNTCMEIAVISAKMTKDGKTPKEIRTYIDQQYKEGYAKPTPTPMPM
ncbi:PCYCGC motif-containing (lipo)protein [Brevibacillus fluminis]|uniref:PCYCGC motif-containing (lipo)protein n=1 Tax=Brevibacillus fluminis TaxID=511487 RepID=UPI003F8C1305